MFKQEVIFAIPEGFEITYPTKDGIVDSAKSINLYSPTGRSVKLIAPIKQMFNRAMFALTRIPRDQLEQSANETDASNDTDSGALINLLSMSEEIDYEQFILKFMTLIKDTSIARIDGEMPVTQSFIDKMPFELVEALAGEYLTNFIAPSV